MADHYFRECVNALLLAVEPQVKSLRQHLLHHDMQPCNGRGPWRDALDIEKIIIDPVRAANDLAKVEPLHRPRTQALHLSLDVQFAREGHEKGMNGCPIKPLLNLNTSTLQQLTVPACHLVSI
jgi:hypothetical protein